MPFSERMNYESFAFNKEAIESRWTKKWGDRMNELVFIGQDIDKEKMIAELENCLLQENEQKLYLSFPTLIINFSVLFKNCTNE